MSQVTQAFELDIVETAAERAAAAVETPSAPDPDAQPADGG